MTPDLTKNQRLALVAQAFSPHAPVDDGQLFGDRPDQVGVCIDALFQRGLHIALYGERGVGKTSLAVMLPTIILRVNRPSLNAVRVNCNTEDTFRSVWRKVFRELKIEIDEDELEKLEPEDVRYRLQQLDPRTLIVIDELDRMDDDASLSLLADTIKTLSDHSVRATLMLVGVADSLVNLLGEHESIVRALVQVPMPRMSSSELGSIIDRGAARAELTVAPETRSRIVVLSEGLPHYSHLLAQAACRRCVEDDRDHVTLGDVQACMEAAVDAHSFRSEYLKATTSPQPDNLFAQVLLACAFARVDDHGYFRPADLREPLSALLGRSIDIPNFQRHLQELSGPNRGQTLYREGKARNYRYRFRNPLLQPYTKIRALSKGLLTEEMRATLESLRKPSEAHGAGTSDPSALGPLFER